MLDYRDGKVTKVIQINVDEWLDNHFYNFETKEEEIRELQPTDECVKNTQHIHLYINDDFDLENWNWDRDMLYCIKSTNGRIPKRFNSEIKSIPLNQRKKIVEGGEEYIEELELLGNTDVLVGMEIKEKMDNNEKIIIMIDDVTNKVSWDYQKEEVVE